MTKTRDSIRDVWARSQRDGLAAFAARYGHLRPAAEPEPLRSTLYHPAHR